MICLRCGYCCNIPWVLVVTDPDKGLELDNWEKCLNHRCKHLVGNRPGEYSCPLHANDWYVHTPCHKHGRLKTSENEVCEKGKMILEIFKESGKESWTYEDFIEASKLVFNRVANEFVSIPAKE